MTKETKKTGFGLQQLPQDNRDFSHATVFGAVAISDLPTGDFFVSETLGIKDQKNKDFCAAYAVSAVSEDQEGIELNPEFLFKTAKKLIGGESWKDWGLNLRDVCNAIVKVGSLEQQFYPFEGKVEDTDRNFLANPANWPEDLDMLAADHRKNSYFAVDGPYGIFDNIRMTMWKNRNEARSVLTGVKWRYSWNSAPRGIIPVTGWENDPGEGHAIKVFGQALLDNPNKKGEKKLYLVVQNSWGLKVGDGGFFYFPAEVVNKEFTYGAYTFKDMPRDYAQYHNENNICVDQSVIEKFIKVLINFLVQIMKRGQ